MSISIAQTGTGAIALSTANHAEPYRFTFDSVSGMEASQQDIFEGELVISLLVHTVFEN